MSYYVTTPFGDNRALVSTEKPMDTDAYFVVESLPKEIEYMVVEDGHLVHKAILSPVSESPNPFDILAQENAHLKAQLAHSDDAALMMFEEKAAMDDAVITLYEKIQGGTKLYESLFNYLLAKNQSAG